LLLKAEQANAESDVNKRELTPNYASACHALVTAPLALFLIQALGWRGT
jgi:hypothetical protein